jgi:hypothetical protein
LVSHLLAEFVFHKLAGGLSDPETGDLSLGHQVIKLFFVVLVDVATGNGDLDVSLTGALLLNVQLEIQRLLSGASFGDFSCLLSVHEPVPDLMKKFGELTRCGLTDGNYLQPDSRKTAHPSQTAQLWNTSGLSKEAVS